MTNDEKINFIDNFENAKEISEKDFMMLKILAHDKDSFVRSRCASVLSNFVNNDSCRLLLGLVKDDDEFVRTETYDSLALFKNQKVADTLYNAITEEKDSLARCYAIMSWVDITCFLKKVGNSETNFLEILLQKERSEDCMLSCYYGLYKFGEEAYLDKIFTFLGNDDYHLRCSALNILWDLTNNGNKEKIKKAILPLLDDASLAVKDIAKRLYERIGKL